MHGIPSTIIEESSESSLANSEVNEVPEIQPVKSDHLLLSIIADEDTCVGYILGGIGEVNEEDAPNYFVVNSTSTDKDIEKAYTEFISRKDMGIVLITKENADRIHLPHKKSKTLPIVIEIPDKNGPYTIEIDHLLDIAQSHEKVKEEKVKNLQERRSSSQERDSIHLKRSSNSSEKTSTK